MNSYRLIIYSYYPQWEATGKISRRVCAGDNSSFRGSSVLQVPFLNLMANIKDRAGAVHIRVGGNTQETATLVDSLPDGLILEKDNEDTNNPVSDTM